MPTSVPTPTRTTGVTSLQSGFNQMPTSASTPLRLPVDLSSSQTVYDGILLQNTPTRAITPGVAPTPPNGFSRILTVPPGITPNLKTSSKNIQQGTPNMCVPPKVPKTSMSQTMTFIPGITPSPQNWSSLNSSVPSQVFRNVPTDISSDTTLGINLPPNVMRNSQPITITPVPSPSQNIPSQLSFQEVGNYVTPYKSKFGEKKCLFCGDPFTSTKRFTQIVNNNPGQRGRNYQSLLKSLLGVTVVNGVICRGSCLKKLLTMEKQLTEFKQKLTENTKRSLSDPTERENQEKSGPRRSLITEMVIFLMLPISAIDCRGRWGSIVATNTTRALIVECPP